MSTRMGWSCAISKRRTLRRSRLRRRYEAIRALRHPGRLQIEITDHAGNTLLIMPLREILDSLKGAPKAHPMENAERPAKLSAEIKQSVSTAHERLRESQALLAKLSADPGFCQGFSCASVNASALGRPCILARYSRLTPRVSSGPDISKGRSSPPWW